jgi:hypothetical protein
MRSSLSSRFPLVTPVSLLTSIGLVPALTVFLARVSAQAPARVEFDVVSIKRVDELRSSGGGRTLPDGTIIMTNRPVATFIQPASPVPVVDVIGLPEWTDLKPSTLDCTPRPIGPSTPPPPATAKEWQNRCGMFMSAGLMVSGGMQLDQLVLSRRHGRKPHGTAGSVRADAEILAGPPSSTRLSSRRQMTPRTSLPPCRRSSDSSYSARRK